MSSEHLVYTFSTYCFHGHDIINALMYMLISQITSTSVDKIYWCRHVLGWIQLCLFLISDLMFKSLLSTLAWFSNDQFILTAAFSASTWSELNISRLLLCGLDRNCKQFSLLFQPIIWCKLTNKYIMVRNGYSVIKYGLSFANGRKLSNPIFNRYLTDLTDNVSF